MQRFTPRELIEATGGLPLEPIRPAGSYTVTTDSRTVAPGEVFVALRGERYDAHDFLPQVLACPETAVIGLRDRLLALPPPLRDGRLLIAVSDPLHALGDVAHFARARHPATFIGLTGSSGKTTTKELLRAVLASRGPVLATEGNLNNLVGVPLMLLRLEPSHRYAILEMGMNAFGEIARLAQLVAPTIRLITNIGAAHTQGVGSIEGVARAKLELFDAPGPATLVVNADDPFLRAWRPRDNTPCFTYGCGEGVDLRLVSGRPLGGLGSELTLQRLGGQPFSFAFPLIGRHNALNALAAAAVGLHCGLSEAEVAQALAGVSPVRMRMERSQLPGDVTVLNDAYNANPAAMAAALEALIQVRQGTGRAVAVLGDMLELGSLEAQAHRALGERAASMGVDGLFLWGERSRHAEEGALSAGLPRERVVHAMEHAALAQALHAFLLPGDVVLFKGSRGSKMERVLEALKALRGKESLETAVRQA